MDLNNLKDALGQLLNQNKLNLPIGQEEEKQVGRIVDKLRNKQNLSDDDRHKAVKLVSQFSKQLSPDQSKQLKSLLDQLMKTQKISEKDQKALEQIKKML